MSKMSKRCEADIRDWGGKNYVLYFQKKGWYVRFAINQYSRYPNLITCYCFLTRRQDVTCLFIDIFCWFFSMAFVALKHILHYLTTIRWPEIMIDLRLGLRVPFFSFLFLNVKTHYARLVNFLFYLFVRRIASIAKASSQIFIFNLYFE